MWINKFAAQARIELTDEQIQLWKDELGDLDPVALQAAFRETMRTFVYPRLPTIADIRGHVDGAVRAAKNESADVAWDRITRWKRENYFHDLPNRRRSNPTFALLDREEYALRLAGGFARMDNAQENGSEDLVWMKKDFVAAWERWDELRANGNLLTGSDAAAILRDLNEPTKPVPQLSPWPGAYHEPGKVYPQPITLDNSPEPKRPPVPELSPEELERRRAEQKARLYAKFPDLAPKADGGA